MALFRRFLVVFAVLASVAGVASTRALATPPPDCTITQPEVVSSEHFDVWYSADPTKPNYITQKQAYDIAASGEQAYAAYKAMGFPTPMVDPFSGTTQIQVLDLSPWSLASVICDGSFDFDSGSIGSNNEQYDVGADVFSEIENFLFVPNFYEDYFLPQGAASWASWAALGYPAASTEDIGPFDMSLNCFNDIPDTANCSKTGFENLGQSRWPFYDYLAERFGALFIKEVLLDAAVADDSVIGLQNALVAHGTTLTAEYNGFATKMMSGGWSAPSLNVAAVPIAGAPINTGAATGDVPAQTVNINHLATKYFEFDRGDGGGDHPCFAATLTITVQIPTGVASQPAFYWNDGSSAPVNLTVSGTTATTTVPWDTCSWPSSTKGLLSLPNAGTTVDGKKFTVAAHLTVDKLTPAAARVPPSFASPWGEIINVPAASAVPAISVFGPELLKVSPNAQQIRLLVESSGEGSVAAAIGAIPLGNSSLRPGENDLRFTVPQGVLKALVRRLTATGATVLTLTPTSLDGKATGPGVTQQLSILTAVPAKVPAKKTRAKNTKATKPIVKKKTPVKKPPS